MGVQRWKGWLLAVIAGLLAACGQSAPAAPPAARPSAGHAAPAVNVRAAMTERWLAGQPCAPPCWEGLVPGQSSAPEAAQILGHSPDIASLSTDEDRIRWDWSDRVSADAGEITVVNGRVEQIRLDFAPRLGAVIAAYGEPSGVVAYTSTRSEYPGSDLVMPIDAVRIVYAEQGFYFDALPAEQPRIDADLMLIGPVLIGPDRDPADLLPRPGTELVPWQGAQSFDFYYRGMAFHRLARR